jgi:small subunit ribosomal protein S16
MLKLRLARVGRKNRPLFRIVITEKSAAPKSGYISSLGIWDPVNKKLDIDKNQVKDWLNKGAQPSDTVHNILVKEKIIKGEKIRTTTEKKSKKSTSSETSDKEKKANSEKKEADNNKETKAASKDKTKSK